LPFTCRQAGLPFSGRTVSLPREGIALRQSTFLLVLLVILAVPAAAQRRAEQPYRPSAPTIMATPIALAIAAFDSNGDLQVAQKELDEQVGRSFKLGDTDGDGSIGLIELSAWAERTLGNPTAVPGPFNFDKDGDDKISSDEFRAEFSRRFATMDTNKDSMLSRAELVTIVTAPVSDRWLRRNRPAPEGQGQRPPR
jgi:hypothetical protein